MPPPAAAIFSVLLILTGGAKLRRPRDTARALSATGIPFPLAATYVLAWAEVVIGTASIVTGSAAALGAQAALYGLFLVWVVVALARDIPIASCGCLGRDDTPPHTGHLVLNAAGVAGSILGASLGSPPYGDALEVVAATVVAAAGAWLGWSVLGEGARVAALLRR